MLRRALVLLMLLMMLPVISLADETVPYEVCTFSATLPEQLKAPLSALIPDETKVISGAAIKHNGYHYMCTAVQIFSQDSTQALTKELYTAVGAAYGVCWQQVERSIRTALDAAWERTDEQLWRKWFGGSRALKRPTGGEVISRLAEYLRFQRLRKNG